MSHLRLSKGFINAMLDGRVKLSDAAFEAPLLQLLGTKPITEGLVRVVLFDGRTINQHGILSLEDHATHRLFADGLLDKFAVVRALDCSTNKVPTRNMTVLLLSKIELVCAGE